MNRGLCSACGRERSVRQDNKVRQHQDVLSGVCPGSGQPPAVILPQDPEWRRLFLQARDLRRQAEQRLAESLACLDETSQRIAEILARHGLTSATSPPPARYSSEDEVLFTHPDLIDLDLADAFWRPQ